MTYFFFSLIFIFTLLVARFLWFNDFSTVTLDILFPAVGAVLPSFFLAYQSIWLDAPSAVVEKLTVGLMHDKVHGKVYSMHRFTEQAKVERQCMEYLQQRILKEFSFERLKEYYLLSKRCLTSCCSSFRPTASTGRAKARR